MKKEDPAIQQYVNGLDIQDRLDVRDAFFGGRCENYKKHDTCGDGERIRYLDFTSLYPYVLKSKTVSTRQLFKVAK